MDYVIGKYQYCQCINPEVFLGLAGEEITSESVKMFISLESTLTFEIKDNMYTFWTTMGEYWSRVCRFKIGGQFSESRAMTVVTRDGNKLIFTTTEGGQSYRRIYDFSESGVVMTATDLSGQMGTRIFKRIE